MFGITRWRATTKTLSVSLALAMTLSLWGCGGSPSPSAPIVKPETRVAAKSKPVKLSGRVSEASPPEVIQQLREVLDQYQPQVSIVAPKSNEVLQDNTVSVQLRVKDLPIFKDEKLGLGPHLHVFLDDQPYQAVYDVSQPLVLKDLAPGTHTVRVFAGRPWHESFKNDGAYAQTTFHIFTKTPNNNPKSDLPLLTYSRPQGVYGAEPILLDFYLTNAPLHFVAQEDTKDEVADWQVRATVNGDSFVLDRWQPIYLKGLKPGKNWVQLEYIDEKGNPVANVYNNTARVFTYEPNGQDTLSKLVRGELSFAQARGIVDPNYKPEDKPVPIKPPAPIETPEPAPIPVVPVPEVEEQPAEPETPQGEVEEKVPETVPVPGEQAKPKGGFFNRFKQSTPATTPSTSPSPAPIPSELPAVEPEEVPEELIAPEEVVPEVEVTPEAKPSPTGGFFNRFKGSAPKPIPVEPSPASVPDELPAVEPEEIPEESKASEEVVPEVESTPAAKPLPQGGLFDRFKGLTPTPAPVEPSPTIPAELPAAEPEEVPAESAAPEEVVPEVETAPVVKPSPKGGFFNRFKGLAPKPTPVEPSPAPLPAELPSSEPEGTLEKSEPEVVPEVEATPDAKPLPQGGLFNRFKDLSPKPAPVEPSPAPLPSELPASEPEEIPEKSEVPEVEVTPEAKPTPKGGFFNRFKLPTVKSVPSAAPVESSSPSLAPSAVTEPEVKSPESDVEETPQGGLFDRFKRSETPAVPSVSPTPLPTELTAPETEQPDEKVPEVVAPKVKEAPKPSFFDRFKPTIAPSPSPAPAESPIPVEVEPAEPETAEIEAPKSEPTPAPKSGFFNRFKLPEPKPSPSIAPLVPDTASEPEPSIEQSESVQPKAPEPAVKEAPKVNLFDRFTSPTVKPSAPAETSSEPSQPAEVVQPEDSEPAVKEAPKVNLFERFKPSIAKPSAPPETAPSESSVPAETLKAEESKTQPTDATPGFEPKSELERLLGVPVKPPILAPAKPIARPQPAPPAPEVKQPETPKFSPPKSSDLFKRKESNPFFRSAKSPTSEPTEAPTTSEAPSVESTPEAVPIE